jgi:hypothetical protein
VPLVRDGRRRETDRCGALTAIYGMAISRISRDGRGRKKEAGSATWMGVVQGQPPAARGHIKWRLG